MQVKRTFLLDVDDLQVEADKLVDPEVLDVVVDVLGHDGVVWEVRSIVRERVVGERIVVFGDVTTRGKASSFSVI